MAEESAKLRIPYIAAAQAQKHVTHNEAMTLLDTLVQLSVIDKDLNTPPSSPVEGDTYIVAPGGTGAWIGWDKRIVRFIDGIWRSYLPGAGGGAGWLAWVMDEDAMYRFDGTVWTPAGIEGPEGPPGPQGPQGDPGSAGAAGADGTDPGILLTWDTGTSDADPGPGKLRADNASLASATFLYISKSNRAGSNIAGKLLSLDDSTNASRKAGLILTDPASEVQAFLSLLSITDATGYVKAAVGGHSGATSFANGIAISLQDARDGDKGADGGGSGDVVGPSSAADGRFVLFDGATGKLIKEHTGTPGALAVKNTVAASDIDNDAVTDTKLRNSLGLSVIGRSANSTGDPADIAAAADGDVLRRSGTSLGFGQVGTAGIANDAVTYAKMQNVSATDRLIGRSSAGAGDPEEIVCTAAGRALIDDANAAAQRATLGLGTAAIEADTKYAHRANNLSDVSDAFEACKNLATWRVLANSGAAALVTGTTNETVLATIAVPAGAMGANGILRITTNWTTTNNANAKTLRVRFGGISGTAFSQVSNASQIRDHLLTMIYNRNSANSQIGGSNAGNGTGYGVSTTAQVTAALNTANAQDIVLTGELGNTGDTITLEAYVVELMSKP